VVGHITPEAMDGGPLAVVRDGDRITIDARANEIRLHLEPEEISARLATWTAPPPRYTRGVLAKFARSVRPASEGAVTDRFD
jgi:dihydroxy-acid dehydratase